MTGVVARLVAWRWTIPALILSTILSMLLAFGVFLAYSSSQDDEQRERQHEMCLEANRLRRDFVEAEEATESLIRSILNVVLRPGEGDAERRLAVQSVYREFRPAFEHHAAVLERIGTAQDCSSIYGGPE